MKTKNIILGISALALMSVPTISSASPATVTVGGAVAPACSITLVSPGTIALDLDDAAATQSVFFDLACNQPSDVSYESSNGYLKLQAADVTYDSADPDNGIFTSGANALFDAGIDYIIDINGNMWNTSALDSGVDTVVFPNGPAGSVTNQEIKFTPDYQGSLPLLGGAYEDTLVITLTPQAI